MIFRIVVLSILLAGHGTMGAAAAADGLSNQLKNHPAPYLALHGGDPVAWQEWNQAAVEKAVKQNRMLYLSVGYFACHWCHVMQEESYQNKDIAEYLNTHFIPVKIDRELEPALDRRLMDFTQQIIGRGGWPLNVFLTPSGYPIFSVLYAPPAQFMETLKRLQEVWQLEPDKVIDLVTRETIRSFPDADPQLDETRYKPILDGAVAGVLIRSDPERGGFGEQNKFPSVPQLQFLLQRYEQSADKELKQFLIKTLDRMSLGGLNDHLAGGFFRYTVDVGWNIPHFEKMLYDNANLASLYIRAGEAFSNDTYRTVARRTLDFMVQRMWDPQGALVSSFSAVDDDSIEGGSYLWTREQLMGILEGKELGLALNIWNLDRTDELPAGNHLRLAVPVTEFAQRYRLDVEDTLQIYNTITGKLLTERDKRSLPVDDKLLAGWNGLALSAFVQAATAYPHSNYEKAARALRDFLVDVMWDGANLHRSLAKGNLIGAASVEDYAYVARGLYDWAIFADSESDFEIVKQILDSAWDRFYENNAWIQGDDTLLAPGPGEEMLSDAANPSPSAMLIETSINVARRNSDQALLDKSLSALNRGDWLLSQAAFWYVGQIRALQLAMKKSS